MDLIRKLRKIKTGRTITIDIVVINITKDGKLKNSKPCSKCIECMINFCKEGNYYIRNIYYSKTDETIEKTSLKKLYAEEIKFISTRFRPKKIIK